MAFNKENYLIGSEVKFVDMKQIRSVNENYLLNYVIPLEYAYRPDIICYRLYGDTSYQSAISFINRINDSPEGYYSGRTIKVIDPRYKDVI